MTKQEFIAKLRRVRDRVDEGQAFWSATHAENFNQYASVWTVKPLVDISRWISDNGGRVAALAMLDESIRRAERRRNFRTR